MALTDKLTAIANAIRTKNGTTETMTLDEMPALIAATTESEMSLTLPTATMLEAWNFANCTEIDNLILPSVVLVKNRAFEGSSLKKIDFNAQVTFNGESIFSRCFDLTAIILRYDGVCPIQNASAFDSSMSIPLTSGTGYIYVPQAQLANYKSDSYWKAMTHLTFRSIENYPSITGG